MPDVIDRWAPAVALEPDDVTVVRSGPAAEHRAPGRGGGWRVLRGLPAAAAVVAVSVPGLGNRAMWSDEYATWYASTLSAGDLIRLMNHVDAVVAPYYLFMHAWITVFGDSPAALRAPSVVGMAVAAVLITMLGERLVQAWVGVAAGLTFAVLPVASRYAQEARPYGLAVACALFTTILLLRAFERPDWSRWWVYGAGLLVTGLVHVVALLVLLPHLVALIAVARGSRDFRFWRWLGPVCVVGTALLPMVAKGSGESDAIGWIRANGQAVVQLPGKLAGSGNVALVLAALGAAGFVVLVRTHRAVAITLLVWAIGPVAFCYVTFPVLHLFLFRYLLFTVPAWCLLAGAAAAGLARALAGRWPGWPTVVATAVLTALLVGGVGYVGLPGQSAVRQSPVFGEPDFRAAASVVSGLQQPGDGIAYAATTRNGRRATAYELRGRAAPVDTFLAASSQSQGQFGAVECAEPGRCVRDTARIWLLVVGDDSAPDPYTLLPPAIARLLRDEFTVGQRWRLTGVSVYLLTRVG